MVTRGTGIVRVSSGFLRGTTEKVSGHCVCGSRATGDFQKDVALSIVNTHRGTNVYSIIQLNGTLKESRLSSRVLDIREIVLDITNATITFKCL